MKQTTLSLPLEVKPESYSRLSVLIELINTEQDTGKGGFPENYAAIQRDIPVLHFMSMSVFPAAAYDPIFVLEANFDGSAGVFWAQLEAALGERLREVVRCCKRPSDSDGPLYDAVTAAGSKAALAAYFEARTQEPSVFHHGNRGMTRDRILREDALFIAVREEIDRTDRPGPCPYRGLQPGDVHARLRTALRETYAWLDTPSEARVSAFERAEDFLRLAVFAVAVLLALSLPGLALAALVSGPVYLIGMAVIALVAAILIYRKRKPLPGAGVKTSFRLAPVLLRRAPLIAALVAIYVASVTPLLTVVVVATRGVLHLLRFGDALTFTAALPDVAADVLWGLVGIVVSLAVLLHWVRHLEVRDSSQDAPIPDQLAVRDMERREDWIAQNHMGSIVLVKPGVLRSLIIHIGHRGLGLLLRWLPASGVDGYLGSMRTVHFAHWAFLNNGSRLLFFSNFDHSWGSYLDDFIEKAAVGLTLAWGSGVGFPATRFLILDGASHGRQFKAWALASRTVTRFWYSAYRNLTVDQIERNNRIANGLRTPQLSPSEAAAWIRDL